MSAAVRRHLENTTVYRGQWCGSDEIASELPAIAFGSQDAASTYATTPNQVVKARTMEQHPVVFAARLHMERPYCLTRIEHCDPFLDLDIVGEEFGRDVVEALVRDWGEAIENSNAFEEMSADTGRTLDEMVAAWPSSQEQLPPIEAYHAIDTPEFLSALKTAGYDGMAFGGSGETMSEMEWHVFDASQAVSVLSGQPLSSAREVDVDLEMESSGPRL